MTLVIALIIFILFSLSWLFVWAWFYRVDKGLFSRFQNVGNKAFEKGNYKKAKELLLKALKKGKDNESTFRLAVSHMNLKEYSEAKAAFELVLSSSPDNIDALMNLAKVYQELGDLEKSIETYKKVLSLNPKNIECLLNIAKLYYAKGEYEKSLETLNYAKDGAPENEDCALMILKCRSELCDVDKVDEYESILGELSALEEKSGASSDYDMSCAKIFAKSGEMEKAFEHCQKTILTSPEDIEAYQLMGLIQLIRQDFEGAKNTLNVALGFDPKNEETHNIFSYVLCQQVDDCPLQKCRDKYYKLIKKYLK